MPIKLGDTSIGSLYLGSTKISEAYLGSVKVFGSVPTLPPYTIRLKFTDGVTPTFSQGTLSQVSASPNVWDVYYTNVNWTGLCANQDNLIEVIDANTFGVTNMQGMFYVCTSLTSVPLFDTSSVINMSGMFYWCTSLTSVPLFDTSSVTNMINMFHSCKNVQSGALALYQQASTQTTPPTSHRDTFLSCGYNTASGRAELAQIPASWGGIMA